MPPIENFRLERDAIVALVIPAVVSKVRYSVREGILKPIGQGLFNEDSCCHFVGLSVTAQSTGVCPAVINFV